MQDAFQDATKAREDMERYKNEAQAYANEIVPKARGEAARMIQDTLAYKEQVIANAEGDADRFSKLLKEYKRAPEVTRKRLYMDALESVLSNSSKLMIDIKAGNNLMLLPLDKIINSKDISEDLKKRMKIMNLSATKLIIERVDNNEYQNIIYYRWCVSNI